METRSIAYTVDETDRAHALAAIELVVPRHTSWLVSVIFGALAVLNVLGFVVTRHTDTVELGVTGFSALAAGFSIVSARSRGASVARIGTRVAFDVGASGLTFTEPRPATVRWAQVAAVTDAAESFVVVRKLRGPIAIPKRALPDGGTALWNDLDAHLTGRRDLVRARGVLPSIRNTRATG